MLRRRVFGGDRVVDLRKEYTIIGLSSSFDFYADCSDYSLIIQPNTYLADFSYSGSIDVDIDVRIDTYDIYLSGKEEFVGSEDGTITCDECSSDFKLRYNGYREICEFESGYITLYSSEEGVEIDLNLSGGGDDDISEEDIDDVQDAVLFNLEVYNNEGHEFGKSDISVNDGTAHVSVW